MATINFGYGYLNLIRRPYKKLHGDTTGNSEYKYMAQPTGDFELIPLESSQCYNAENQVFPFDVNNGQHIQPTNIQPNSTIYLISDPDVGMMIPHIIERSKTLFAYQPMYKNTDIDSVLNKGMIGNKSSTFDSQNYKYSVGGFIFVQPIFQKIHNDNNSDTWYVFAPRYKVNDNDVHFDKFTLNPNFFSSAVTENRKDVVISNKNIEDMGFSQFGLGKNGISLVNGFKYTIDKAGNTRFNIGNIKSDSTAYILTDDGTNEYFELKIDSSSYNKGDVLSGSSFSALLGSVLFSLGAEDLYNCEKCTISGSTMRVINNCDFDTAEPLRKFTIFEKEGGSVSVSNLGLSMGTYGDNTNENDTWYTLKDSSNQPVTNLDAGCYYDIFFDGTNFILSPNKKLPKVNALLKKMSNYDILLVKK